MEKRPTLRKQLAAPALGAALSACLAAAPASAQVYTPVIMPAMTAAVSASLCPVDAPGQIALAEESRPSVSKSSAILGGAPSALDAIRAQQDGFQSMGPLIPGAGPSADTIGPAQVSVALAISPLARCGVAGGAAPAARLAIASDVASPAPSPNEFLASRRVEIAKTNFDASWDRVSRERVSLGREVRRLTAKASPLEDKLATINQWVNRRISYKEDIELFGRADYWAGPRRTIQLGAGDCEDYALLKMHMLAAAGVPREDMFLTIARDLVRRADHAVLIVRTPDGFRMLDNASDTVLDASAANDYQPVLSFSGRKSWLHGY